MKIRRIQLYRFKGFEDLQLIFPTNAKLLVFIGENGSGKTSFMEGIAMILQDTLYKHHRYDRVNWQNPQNVNTNYEYGSIAIGLQGAKRSYDFSQTLSANHIKITPELYLTNDKASDLQHLNEYLEAELPLILQYNAKQGSIENYKDALPIAFAIPMTTNFDMISDWFTEYEN